MTSLTARSSEPAGGKPFPTFMGSKDAAGLAQQISSRFPPHATYVELFLGGGAVLRHKRPALCSIAIDADARVIDRWRAAAWPGVELIHGDALSWLTARVYTLPADTVIYADPPYPHSTRTSRRRYAYELSDQEHLTLIDLLERVGCNVFLSSYDSPLYRSRLGSWQHAEFPAMTRGGLRTEHLWWRSTIASFSVAARSVGSNYRERERMKRRRQRWRANFKAMSQEERAAMLSELLDASTAGTAIPDDGDVAADTATHDGTRSPAVIPGGRIHT